MPWAKTSQGMVNVAKTINKPLQLRVSRPTQALTMKQREAVENGNHKQWIECAEICKTIKKKTKEDIRKHNQVIMWEPKQKCLLKFNWVSVEVQLILYQQLNFFLLKCIFNCCSTCVQQLNASWTWRRSWTQIESRHLNFNSSWTQVEKKALRLQQQLNASWKWGLCHILNIYPSPTQVENWSCNLGLWPAPLHMYDLSRSFKPDSFRPHIKKWQHRAGIVVSLMRTSMKNITQKKRQTSKKHRLKL